MTRNQWIHFRQQRSTVSIDEIFASGWDVVPCGCGKIGCLGWKLARTDKYPAFNNTCDPPRAA